MESSDVTQFGKPDLTALEALFEVRGTRQVNQLNTLNGDNRATTRWIITLLPKENGSVVIPPLQLGDAALECLLGYRWPGNVRQLRHVLRYACAVCEGPLIQLADLPEALRSPGLLAPPADDSAEQGSSPERQTLIDARGTAHSRACVSTSGRRRSGGRAEPRQGRWPKAPAN